MNAIIYMEPTMLLIDDRNPVEQLNLVAKGVIKRLEDGTPYLFIADKVSEPVIQN